MELCGLETPPGVEGESLVPLLKESRQETDRAVVTTWGHRNHSVRSKRWRYIHYSDGSEELYDHDHDPGEFYNLADEKQYRDIKRQLASHLPEVNQPPFEDLGSGQ
jgi:hypothetical protein